MTDHETLIFDLFAHQDYLEQISLKIDRLDHSSTFISRFIPHLIYLCTRLEHLKLHLPGHSVDLSSEMFHALVISKLISLKTNIYIRMNNLDVDDAGPIFTASDYSLTNTILRVLRIPNFVNYQIQVLFIQCFRNLEFLELECFFGTILESIGRFQVRFLFHNS